MTLAGYALPVALRNAAAVLVGHATALQVVITPHRVLLPVRQFSLLPIFREYGHYLVYVIEQLIFYLESIFQIICRP